MDAEREVPLPKLAFTLKEAALSTGLSTATLKSAIHSTSTVAFPHHLRARRAGRRYIILEADLRQWLEAMPRASEDPFAIAPRSHRSQAILDAAERRRVRTAGRQRW